jgi:hypothetical protein
LKPVKREIDVIVEETLREVVALNKLRLALGLDIEYEKSVALRRQLIKIPGTTIGTK